MKRENIKKIIVKYKKGKWKPKKNDFVGIKKQGVYGFNVAKWRLK